MKTNETMPRTAHDQMPGESFTEPAQQTIGQFIEKHNLGFECKRVEGRPDGLMDGDWGNELKVTTLAKDKMRHFRCMISAPCCNGTHTQKKIVGFGVYFSQGSGHTADPTLADVLDCLASDASGYDATPAYERGFELWAYEYGYDTDSRKAEKTYKAIKRQAEQMRRTLGDAAYDELLYNTERV